MIATAKNNTYAWPQQDIIVVAQLIDQMLYTKAIKDIYIRKARYDGYRARSAYKLIQIDEKYKFLTPGKVVIDVGAAPGSWTQVICEKLDLAKNSRNGKCIAIDLNTFQPVDGATCVGNADFTLPSSQDNIIRWLKGKKVDCILSDMAPSASGHKFHDHAKIVNLVESLIPFSSRVLKPGSGILLAKLWNGESKEALFAKLQGLFDRVDHVKPDASRDDSAELYLYCRGYKGTKV